MELLTSGTWMGIRLVRNEAKKLVPVCNTTRSSSHVARSSNPPNMRMDLGWRGWSTAAWVPRGRKGREAETCGVDHCTKRDGWEMM